MKSDKITGGLLLICIGILFLLSNFGYINWSILGNIIYLWPLILVVLGINIIFREYQLVKVISWLLFLVVFVGYGFYNGERYMSKASLQHQNTIIQNNSKTRTGEVNISFGGAKLDLSGTNSNLMEIYGDNNIISPHVKYTNDEEKVVVDLKTNRKVTYNIGNKGFDYRLRLNESIIWDIDGDLGAITGRLDLSDLKIDRLDLDFGASNLEVVMGDKHNMTTVDLDAGASNLDLVFPEALGVKLKVDGVISKTTLSDLGWPQQGGYYTSPNYDSAESKVVFDVDMGVGRLNVRIKD